MAKLKKRNRILTVDNDRAQSYLNRGYDQIDENGKIIKAATGGKTISVAEFNNLKEKYEELKESTGGEGNEKIAELEADVKLYEQEQERLEEEVKKYKGMLKQRDQGQKSNKQ